MFYNAVEFEDLKTRAMDNYKKIRNDYHEGLHNKSREVDGIIERYDLKDKEALKIVKKSLKNLNLACSIFRDEEGNKKLAEAAEEVEVVLDKYLAHLNN